MEIWKEIPINKIYKISNFGRYSSERKNKYKILKPKKMHDGYLMFRISVQGKQKFINAHRIIAQLFIENKHNKKEVNHINGIRDDNRVSNLEWVTPKENIKHAIDRGTFANSLKNLFLSSRGTKFNIQGFYNGMTKTKEGKSIYMQQYRQIKKQK